MTGWEANAYTRREEVSSVSFTSSSFSSRCIAEKVRIEIPCTCTTLLYWLRYLPLVRTLNDSLAAKTNSHQTWVRSWSFPDTPTPQAPYVATENRLEPIFCVHQNCFLRYPRIITRGQIRAEVGIYREKHFFLSPPFRD